jgi:hypothetical protein
VLYLYLVGVSVVSFAYSFSDPSLYHLKVCLCMRLHCCFHARVCGPPLICVYWWAPGIEAGLPPALTSTATLKGVGMRIAVGLGKCQVASHLPFCFKFHFLPFLNGTRLGNVNYFFKLFFYSHVHALFWSFLPLLLSRTFSSPPTLTSRQCKIFYDLKNWIKEI